MAKKPTKIQDGGSEVDPGESNSPPTLSPDTLATQSLLLDISSQLGSLKSDVKHLNDRFGEARAEMASNLKSFQDTNGEKLDALEKNVGGIKSTLRIWAIVGGVVALIFVAIVGQNLGAVIEWMNDIFNPQSN